MMNGYYWYCQTSRTVENGVLAWHAHLMGVTCLGVGKKPFQKPEPTVKTEAIAPITAILIGFTQEEWTRIALALSTAQLEYMRTAHSRGQKEADPATMERAHKAGELCNRVCDAAGLDEIFRCEESR